MLCLIHNIQKVCKCKYFWEIFLFNKTETECRIRSSERESGYAVIHSNYTPPFHLLNLWSPYETPSVLQSVDEAQFWGL